MKGCEGSMRVILRIAVRTFFVLLIFLGLVLAFLTITEYNPEAIETLSVEEGATVSVEDGMSLSFMSFNVGYAGLGKAEDFVLDGGQKTRPDSKDVVEDYLSGIRDIIDAHSVDFYLLQEVDVSSRRSFNINQVEIIKNHIGESYSSVFAYNFKAVFVPFPLSLTDFIGPVESGLQTVTRYDTESAERHQFPGAFDWPVRVVNLKRAMLITRHEVEGSERELVVVNLHMSAYDSDGSLRNAEMAYLKTFMESEIEKDNYVIIGGDFNQTFPGAEDAFPTVFDPDDDAYYVAHPIGLDFLPEGYQFWYDASVPTCRSLNQPYDPTDEENTQYYVIDGFIVSNNIRVDRVETLEYGFLYSDHNPVKLVFKLEE